VSLSKIAQQYGAVYDVGSGDRLYKTAEKYFLSYIRDSFKRFSNDESLLYRTADFSKFQIIPFNSAVGGSVTEFEVGKDQSAGSYSSLTSAYQPSPDDSLLATGGDDHVVKIWDMSTQKNILTLGQPDNKNIRTGHTMPVHDLVFTGSGTTLASNSKDQTVRLWDLNAGNLTRTIDFKTDEAASRRYPDPYFSFSSCYRKVLLAGSGMNEAQLWDVGQQQCERYLGAAGSDDKPGKQSQIAVEKAFFTSGTNQVLTADNEGCLRLWDNCNVLQGLAALSGRKVQEAVQEAVGRPVQETDNEQFNLPPWMMECLK
jgi:WD40 repeat protein